MSFLRAPTNSELVIVRCFLHHYKGPESRKTIYAKTAVDCGVTYERVERICRRLILERDGKLLIGGRL